MKTPPARNEYYAPSYIIIIPARGISVKKNTTLWCFSCCCSLLSRRYFAKEGSLYHQTANKALL